jgi:SAM-dependent methyltransferase
VYHLGVRASDWLLEPVDYVARVINERRDFPPLRLRRYVGPLRTFESSGAEFGVYFKMICGIRPGESILDIGCGCGLIVPHIAASLDRTATYVGVDIHRPSITWCQNHITRANPRFRFAHIDVKNEYYNPRGRVAAADFEFAFPDGGSDVVLVKSVFTHMRPADVDNYLRGIKRLMSADGRCLASFYLLNDEQRRLAAQGLNQQDFAFGDADWRYRSAVSPEAAVAFSEESVMRLAAMHGLRIDSFHYGSWSGRPDGLSFQDLVLLRHA